MFPVAHMAALQASLSLSHRQMQTPLYLPPFASTRLCRLSARLPGFRYAEVCKQNVCAHNARHRGTLRPGGLLTPRATARPIDDNQEPFTESVPMAVDNISMDIPRWMDAFHRFTRPHTVIGTAIAIFSISLLAVQSFQDFSSRFAVGLAQAMIPALFMNVYIVGLNQIFDIEIDKVNKPNLPLASGEFSLNTGISIVTIFAILSFAMGAYIGSRPLLWALTVSFILGTAYSIKLPWLRWKRSAFAAATCILAVRAIIVQIAFYLHMQSFVFGRAAILTKPLVFATGFMCFFSIVIALFKDIPDLEGDRFFGIKSYTVRLGQERVFWLCIQLLLAAYGVATIVGATAEMMWARVVMVLGHAVLAGVLWHYASRIDLKSKAAITGFYMFVWKLFYAEYLLIPLMR
eukprot:c2344_g1_i1 orf=446-1657(-)